MAEVDAALDLDQISAKIELRYIISPVSYRLTARRTEVSEQNRSLGDGKAANKEVFFIFLNRGIGNNGDRNV